MGRLNILNSKQVRRINEIFTRQWGTDIPGEHVFFENEKGKVFMASHDFGNVDTGKLRIQSVGCYLGEIAHDEARLSIEGTQIVGPKATKNVIEIGDEEAKAWLAGADLDRQGDTRGYLIIKNRDDYLGCGTYSKSRDRIQNFVSKARRTNVIE